MITGEDITLPLPNQMTTGTVAPQDAAITERTCTPEPQTRETDL